MIIQTLNIGDGGKWDDKVSDNYIKIVLGKKSFIIEEEKLSLIIKKCDSVDDRLLIQPIVFNSIVIK